MLNSFSINAFAVIESVVRMLMYISIIGVAFKGVQALNLYINKHSR